MDRKVLRILKLAARVGALRGFEPMHAELVDTEDLVAFAREASIAGTVMVKNDGILPLNLDEDTKVAVIGHNARFARTQGGGSATVIPERVVTPLEGIQEVFGSDNVTYSAGAIVQEGINELPLEHITNPHTGKPGMRVEFVGPDGQVLFAEDRLSTSLVWFGGDAPISSASKIRFHTEYAPEETGTIHLGFSSVGHGRIFADGELLREATVDPVGTDLGAALLAPPGVSAPVTVKQGVPIEILIEITPRSNAELSNTLGVTIGLESKDTDPDELIREATEAARAANVAIVVVGTNSKVESEGYDRTSLALPGMQDRLVSEVAAANPRTVVLVNAGSPVLMPWRNDVAATLIGFFGGQEFGHAFGDILKGVAEPGGRLPTTWPAYEEDVPVINVTPESDGTLTYDEGIHIGYRAWLKAGAEPAYEFGFGLGYTEWTLDSLEMPENLTAGEVSSINITVTNVGSRAGKSVVQVYAGKPDSAVDRPVRWLVASAPVWADAGETVNLAVKLPTRLLAYWEDRWVYESGEYILHVGTSVTKLALHAKVDLVAA